MRSPESNSPTAPPRAWLLLHHAGEEALSIHVGRAWDEVADHVDLARRDHATILAVLNKAPEPELEELRAALEARVAREA